MRIIILVICIILLGCNNGINGDAYYRFNGLYYNKYTKVLHSGWIRYHDAQGNLLYEIQVEDGIPVGKWIAYIEGSTNILEEGEYLTNQSLKNRLLKEFGAENVYFERSHEGGLANFNTLSIEFVNLKDSLSSEGLNKIVKNVYSTYPSNRITIYNIDGLKSYLLYSIDYDSLGNLLKVDLL